MLEKDVMVTPSQTFHLGMHFRWLFIESSRCRFSLVVVMSTTRIELWNHCASELYFTTLPSNALATDALHRTVTRSSSCHLDFSILCSNLLVVNRTFLCGPGYCIPAVQDTCVSSRHSRKCVTLLKLMTELTFFLKALEHLFFDVFLRTLNCHHT